MLHARLQQNQSCQHEQPQAHVEALTRANQHAGLLFICDSDLFSHQQVRTLVVLNANCQTMTRKLTNVLLMQRQEMWSEEMFEALGNLLCQAALLCSVLPEAVPKVCTHAFWWIAKAPVFCHPTAPCSETAWLSKMCLQEGLACALARPLQGLPDCMT